MHVYAYSRVSACADARVCVCMYVHTGGAARGQLQLLFCHLPCLLFEMGEGFALVCNL